MEAPPIFDLTTTPRHNHLRSPLGVRADYHFAMGPLGERAHFAGDVQGSGWGFLRGETDFQGASLSRTLHHHAGDQTPQIECCGLDFFVILVVCALLVFWAAVMSGLTVALLSMDELNMRIIEASGSAYEIECAQLITPLLKRRNLLLVTLLVCNAIAMEALPIYMVKIVPTHVAIFLSVTLVLLFSEVIPQAVFSRFRLSVGAVLARFVLFLMTLLYPICWPIGELLDRTVGTHALTMYRRAELRELTSQHLKTEENPEGPLNPQEVRILTGTLTLADKQAVDAMTPLADTFMLPDWTVLEPNRLREIMASGFSRIPVYSGADARVTGVLRVQNLIIISRARREKGAVTILDVSSEDRPDIRAVFEITRVADTLPLLQLLQFFLRGGTRLALVVRQEGVKDLSECDAIGVVGLEDVIEELLQVCTRWP